MKKKTAIELLFLSSVAVIVLSGFVIISHDKMNQPRAQVEGAKVSFESVRDMMKSLDSMNESSDAGELNQLRVDASKL